MSNTSDGCIAHVSLKLKTEDVLASHDGELYRIIEKEARAPSTAQREKLYRQEIIEHEKVKAAQEEIFKLAQNVLRTLLCMEKLPEMIDENSNLELRLLLCRVKAQ
jgi:hypothetical protein